MSRTSYESQLPLWATQRLAGGKLGLTCPRCQGKAVVAGRRWRSASTGIGRVCTYCFKTSRVPWS